MKILQILEATEGGTRKHLDQLLTGLKDEHEMHFAYSLSRDGNYRTVIDAYVRSGISCHEIPMVRGLAPGSDRRAARQLRELVVRIKPDLIHAHSSKAGFILRLANLRNRCQVYTPHCLYYPPQTGLRRWLYRLGEKWRAARIDCFVAVSDAEKWDLISDITVAERVRRVDNGVDLPPEFPLPADSRRILFPARAVPQKGWQFFLEVARRVIAEEPEAKFVFAGQGGQWASLKSRADKTGLSGCMHLPGFVSDMAAEFRQASVVASTSRWEGQPYSLLEAMAYRCPITAFAIPGMDELIEDGVNGFLIPPFDCAAMAARIVQLLRDSEQRAVMGQSGADKVALCFTRQEFLENMGALYSELADR